MTDRKTKMVVPNDRLKMLVVEKTLPKNGGFPYLFKGGEAGYEEQENRLKQNNLNTKTCTNTEQKSPKS